jgi:hypothetical protein
MAKYSDEAVFSAIEGRRAVRRYPFPGSDSECGIQMLTDCKIDSVRIDAQNYCKGKKVDLMLDPDFLDRAIMRYTILAAFVDPDKPEQQFFEGIDDVMSLDNVMVRTLYELYIAHQQAMDPLAYASREEVDALVAQLGKPGSDEGRLSLFDRPTLQSFVLSMACALRSMRQQPK